MSRYYLFSQKFSEITPIDTNYKHIMVCRSDEYREDNKKYIAKLIIPDNTVIINLAEFWEKETAIDFVDAYCYVYL